MTGQRKPGGAKLDTVRETVDRKSIVAVISTLTTYGTEDGKRTRPLSNREAALVKETGGIYTCNGPSRFLPHFDVQDLKVFMD